MISKSWFKILAVFSITFVVILGCEEQKNTQSNKNQDGKIKKGEACKASKTVSDKLNKVKYILKSHDILFNAKIINYALTLLETKMPPCGGKQQATKNKPKLL